MCQHIAVFRSIWWQNDKTVLCDAHDTDDPAALLQDQLIKKQPGRQLRTRWLIMSKQGFRYFVQASTTMETNDTYTTHISWS